MPPFRPRFHRVDTGASRTAVPVCIDGQAVTALAGDTLLTVLIQHRGALRRAEFGGGLRAGFCAMGACQDCWITLAGGTRVRACSTLVEPGMTIVTDLDDAG
ncbi:(2Fe-2S)-binding protein [Paracoccaceae bacterium Fryx2]|nr:(2Fe-2S)-binding protein [Paracoccaceae bacterium Fryx2]